MENSVNTELIRGHVDTIILRVLQDRDRYGYEILDIIADMSDKRYAIKQPTLYSCLKRLEKLGFISSYFGDESNGGRRRYYKLTDKGHCTLEQDQKEWEFSRSILDKLLSDKQIDLKTVNAPFDAAELRPLTKRVKAYDIPSPAAARTQPIIIPITLETKTVQVAADSSKQPTAATPTQATSLKEPVVQQSILFAAKSQAQEPPAVIFPQDRRIDEQRDTASKLLQIGEYAIPPKTLIEQQITSTHAAKPNAEEKKTEYKEYKEDYPQNNYKDVLGALFTREQTPKLAAEALTPSPKEAAKPDEPTLSRQFYDIKQALAAEGYKLKSYSKSNAAEQYYMNYIYSNRLVRDTSFLLYLTVVIELIIIYIGRNIFGYGLSVLLPIAGAALVLPALGAIIWALNPSKRKKAKFSLSSALINSIIAYILAIALTTVIYLVSPGIDIGFGDGEMYVPFILAANLPIFVLIYNFLYKSKHYHLK